MELPRRNRAREPRLSGAAHFSRLETGAGESEGTVPEQGRYARSLFRTISRTTPAAAISEIGAGSGAVSIKNAWD